MANHSREGCPVYQVLHAAARGDLNKLKKIASAHSHGGEPGKAFTELKDNKGRTALHFAAAEGRTQICKYFVRDIKLDVNLRDGSGDTPLHHAVLAGKKETVVFLIENGANLNSANNKKLCALHYAAEIGHKKLLELLIARGATVEAESASGTPLQCAAAKGRKEAVKLLLDRHANPNVIGSFFTPLMVSLLSGSIDCTILLLKAGADPNLHSLCGTTPLFYAAGEGDVEAIKLLLKSGADPNATDAYGVTPLEAVAMHGCHEGLMVLFPVTRRIPEFPDWSFAGILNHVHSKRYKTQREQKKKELFQSFKSKGEEAFKRKDYLDAMFWYTQAISADPSDASVLSNRSLCWVRLGEGPEALTDAEACVSLKPDWAKAHYREGVARKMLKDLFGAVEAFSEALKLDPENQEIKNAHREAVETEFGIPVSENLRTMHWPL